MSDSVWPHRWQPTRLHHPWDSSGKNTGVGCHFLHFMEVKSENEVTQSCQTLSDPMGWSPPGSSICGMFQARVLEWGATAFSFPCIPIHKFTPCTKEYLSYLWMNEILSNPKVSSLITRIFWKHFRGENILKMLHTPVICRVDWTQSKLSASRLSLMAMTPLCCGRRKPTPGLYKCMSLSFHHCPASADHTVSCSRKCFFLSFLFVLTAQFLFSLSFSCSLFLMLFYNPAIAEIGCLLISFFLFLFFDFFLLCGLLSLFPLLPNFMTLG